MTGHAAMRPEIALSWKRSALSGLEPSSTPTGDSCSDLDKSSRLLQAARPVLDEMEQQIQAPDSVSCSPTATAASSPGSSTAPDSSV